MQVTISGNIDDFTELLWNNLSSVTRVSLFTRFIDVETGETETRVINRNQK